MACLLSFTRRSLPPKWFCSQTSRPLLLLLRHIKDITVYTEPKSSSSSLLVRRFHKQAFFEDRALMSFVQPVVSGVLQCRHMSSSSSPEPEDSCIKVDALGNVTEELASEKTLEAAMTTKVSIVEEFTATFETFSFPEDCVQYVINGIHELTGFNWWMSIVLTALLVNGLMSPISMKTYRQTWELNVLFMGIHKVKTMIKTCDSKALAKYKRLEEELMKELGIAFLCGLNLFVIDGFVYLGFIHEISVMAKKIPEFENGGILWFTDLSTPESFYILPLLTGFIFWFTEEIHKRNTNLASRIKRLPWLSAFFILLQVAFEFESAVYFYLIPTRIYITTLLVLSKPLSPSLFVPFTKDHGAK